MTSIDPSLLHIRGEGHNTEKFQPSYNVVTRYGDGTTNKMWFDPGPRVENSLKPVVTPGELFGEGFPGYIMVDLRGSGNSASDSSKSLEPGRYCIKLNERGGGEAGGVSGQVYFVPHDTFKNRLDDEKGVYYPDGHEKGFEIIQRLLGVKEIALGRPCGEFDGLTPSVVLAMRPGGGLVKSTDSDKSNPLFIIDKKAEQYRQHQALPR